MRTFVDHLRRKGLARLSLVHIPPLLRPHGLARHVPLRDSCSLDTSDDDLLEQIELVVGVHDRLGHRAGKALSDPGHHALSSQTGKHFKDVGSDTEFVLSVSRARFDLSSLGVGQDSVGKLAATERPRQRLYSACVYK